MPRTDALPPDWCLQPDDAGQLPTCTNAGGEWHRTFEGTSGAGEVDAARMALFTDGGLETTYLASTMRRRDEPLPARPEVAPPDVATRLRRLDDLRAQDLLTPEEYAERRRLILDDL